LLGLVEGVAHKRLVLRNLVGILAVPKNYLIEISEITKKPTNPNSEKKKKKATIFLVEKANPLSRALKLTSFEIRLSILKSSLVLTEANFMDRNCNTKSHS